MKLGALLFSLLIMLSFAPFALYQLNHFGMEAARLYSAGIGAVGTLILAFLTFMSYMRSEREDRKQMKQNIRPLVIDEISDVIIPCIEKVKKNQVNLKSNDMGLLYIDYETFKESKTAHAGNAQLLVHNIGLDSSEEAIYRRFKESNPQIYSKISKHDELLLRLIRIANSIYEDLESNLEEIIESNNIKSSSGELVEPKVIAEVLIQADTKMGDKFRNNVWEPHSEEFISTIAKADCSDKFDELDTLKEEYLQYLNTLRSELSKNQNELMSEYWISKEDLQKDKRRLQRPIDHYHI